MPAYHSTSSACSGSTAGSTTSTPSESTLPFSSSPETTSATDATSAGGATVAGVVCALGEDDSFGVCCRFVAAFLGRSTDTRNSPGSERSPASSAVFLMNSRAPALIRTAMRNSRLSSLAPVTSSATCAARTRPAKSSEGAVAAASDTACVSGMATATSPEETPEASCCWPVWLAAVDSGSVVVRAAASISSKPPPTDFLRKNRLDPGDLRIPLALAPLALASSECGVCGV